jgi:phosphoketolase
LLTYGQYAPIVVSDNEVLCGTLIYDALKRLKIKTVYIVQVGKLSEEKKKELRYLDNRTFDMSFWKDDALKVFLMGLDKEQLDDCGFTEREA